jgi:hypothetical protein
MRRNQYIKNLFLGILFYLVFIANINTYAKANKFKNFKWNTTIEQVKKYYPDIAQTKKNIFYKGLYFTSMYTVTQYVENYGVDEILLNREFYFCNDRLGIERIRYYSASPVDLLTEIRAIYGVGKYDEKIHGWASKQIKQNIRTWVLPSGTKLIMIYFNSTPQTNLSTIIGLQSKNFYLNIIFMPPYTVEAYFKKITNSIIKEESMKHLNSFIYNGLY